MRTLMQQYPSSGNVRSYMIASLEVYNDFGDRGAVFGVSHFCYDVNGSPHPNLEWSIDVCGGYTVTFNADLVNGLELEDVCVDANHIGSVEIESISAYVLSSGTRRIVFDVGICYSSAPEIVKNDSINLAKIG